MERTEQQLPLSDAYRQEEAFKQIIEQLNWYTRMEELKELDRQFEDKMEDDDQ